MNKYIKIVAIVAVLGIVVGAYFYPRNTTSIVNVGAPSATGSTFNSSKVAEIIFSPLTSTSTSILNTDATDRIVTEDVVSCSGLGVSSGYTGTGFANLTFTSATTSTATPSSVTNLNQAMNVNITTSTPTDSYNSTTTFTAVFTHRWLAGSYMTTQSNATNTATCSVAHRYVTT